MTNRKSIDVESNTTTTDQPLTKVGTVTGQLTLTDESAWLYQSPEGPYGLTIDTPSGDPVSGTLSPGASYTAGQTSWSFTFKDLPAGTYEWSTLKMDAGGPGWYQPTGTFTVSAGKGTHLGAVDITTHIP